MVLPRPLQKLLARVVEADDSDEVRRQKSVLLFVPLMLIPITTFMGGVYLLVDMQRSATVPFTYAVVSSILLYDFLTTGRRQLHQFSQLVMIMLLPTLLMWMMGGFDGGSVMIFWSFVPPVAAVLLFNVKNGRHWFGAFAVLLLISAVLDERLSQMPIMLPHWAKSLFYVMNIGFVSAGLFALIAGAVTEERVANASLRRKQAHLKRYQKDLVRAKDQAEAGSRAKTEFLANMSHEIRTPMNAIIGLCELTLRSELTPRQQDHLTKVYVSANNLLNIINDLLDISKVEAGKMTLTHDAVDLERLFSDLAASMSTELETKGLELLFDIDPMAPTLVSGDALRLNQILLNLVGNAKKFTAKGDIVLSLRKVAEREGQSVLQFSVRDTGIGLTEEQISRLFQPFSQAEEGTTREYGGTGLGLAICRQLVELMGGTIWVESVYGVGSDFLFEIPFTTLAPDEAVPSLRDNLPHDLAGTRVLVVDDNENACEIIEAQLSHFNLDVTVRSAATEALTEVKRTDSERPFDVILMDYRMPDMDGLSAASVIRNDLSLNKTPKIILVTAASRILDEQEDKQINMVDDILTKPVNPSNLLNAILNVISGTGSKYRNKSLVEPKLGEDDLVPIQGARILLVEDNAINQDVAREFLRPGRFHIDVAEDGVEAVEMVAQGDYDLVLMDIHMPRMDGYEATRKIRERVPPEVLPIVAMTANVFDSDVKEALAAGMNAHIGKPVQSEVLYEKLLTWIPAGDREPYVLEEERVDDMDEVNLPANLENCDLSRALLNVNGNRAFLQKLLLDFLDDHADELSKINTAIAAGDYSTAQRSVHTLKSVLGTIGAFSLHRLASSLETSLKAHALATAADLLDEFSLAYQALVDALLDWRAKQFPDQPEGVAGERDLPAALALVEELEGLIAGFSPGAEEAAQRLMGALPGDEYAEQLFNSCKQFDFGAAETQLSELKGILA